MRTYDIHEAADFLKIDRTTALDLAGAGELPGAKIGRAWVFLEIDLIAYLQDKVRIQTAERREETTSKQHRTGNTVTNGFTARRRRGRPPSPLPDISLDAENNSVQHIS